MGRPKGLPKTGGRKPGSKNKLNLGVREILEAENFDVIREMILLYQKTESEENPGYSSVAAKLLTELASYIYPKRRSIEMDMRSSDGSMASRSQVIVMLPPEDE